MEEKKNVIVMSGLLHRCFSKMIMMNWYIAKVNATQGSKKQYFSCNYFCNRAYVNLRL